MVGIIYLCYELSYAIPKVKFFFVIFEKKKNV